MTQREEELMLTPTDTTPHAITRTQTNSALAIITLTENRTAISTEGATVVTDLPLLIDIHLRSKKENAIEKENENEKEKETVTRKSIVMIVAAMMIVLIVKEGGVGAGAENGRGGAKDVASHPSWAAIPWMNAQIEIVEEITYPAARTLSDSQNNPNLPKSPHLTLTPSTSPSHQQAQ